MNRLRYQQRREYQHMRQRINLAIKVMSSVVTDGAIKGNEEWLERKVDQFMQNKNIWSHTFEYLVATFLCSIKQLNEDRPVGSIYVTISQDHPDDLFVGEWQLKRIKPFHHHTNIYLYTYERIK